MTDTANDSPSERASRSGSLRESSYPELLESIHRHGVSGTLTLTHGEITKTVYFRGGRLIFARSDNPNDRLGEFLLQDGKLTLKQYLDSALRISTGKRQGAILCEMGAISPEDLLSFVQEQVMEIACSLFRWTDGTYTISHGEVTRESIVLSLPIEDVILQGMRRVRDWDRIWKGLGESIAVVLESTDRADSLSYHAALSQDEAHILSLVNGQLDIGRILDLSYTTDFETCRTLWTLRLLGAVAPYEGGSRVEAPSEDYALAEEVEAFAQVFAEIHGFVSEHIDELVDHFMDRVVEDVAERHPEVLRDVHLRNQGRVEYEQIFANVSRAAGESIRSQAGDALSDLLRTLLERSERELGTEDHATLLERLRHVAPGVTKVPLSDYIGPVASGEDRAS